MKRFSTKAEVSVSKQALITGAPDQHKYGLSEARPSERYRSTYYVFINKGAQTLSDRQTDEAGRKWMERIAHTGQTHITT